MAQPHQCCVLDTRWGAPPWTMYKKHDLPSAIHRAPRAIFMPPCWGEGGGGGPLVWPEHLENFTSTNYWGSSPLVLWSVGLTRGCSAASWTVLSCFPPAASPNWHRTGLGASLDLIILSLGVMMLITIDFSQLGVKPCSDLHLIRGIFLLSFFSFTLQLVFLFFFSSGY